VKAPLIDLRLFRDRVFAWANAAIFFANLAFGLELLGLILLMQEGWGWSALKTGLAMPLGRRWCQLPPWACVRVSTGSPRA
jgi:hypothetical protein